MKHSIFVFHVKHFEKIQKITGNILYKRCKTWYT